MVAKHTQEQNKVNIHKHTHKFEVLTARLMKTDFVALVCFIIGLSFVLMLRCVNLIFKRIYRYGYGYGYGKR